MKQFSSICTFLITLMIVTSCGNDGGQEQSVVVDVPFISPQTSDQSLYKDFVGEVLGKSDIRIQARVDGLITGIYFTEGRQVEKGQLLYTIDPLPYEAKVNRARGELASAQSQLAKTEADLNRIKPLAEMDAVSKRELDAAQANYEAAVASVSAQRANLENQNIELSYCRVVAPISGVIGLSNVKEGDYVGKLTTNGLLNTVSDIEGVRVRFSVSEIDLLKYSGEGGDEAGDIEKMDSITDVVILLSNNKEYAHKGKLNVSDRSIDPATGTLRIEAVFPNQEGVLRPGQFVRVRIKYATRRNAIMLPQRAVLEMQGKYRVIIIDESNTIQVKPVEVAERIGDQWVITKGISESDRIAVVGNMFLKPGTVVNPVSPAVAQEQTTN